VIHIIEVDLKAGTPKSETPKEKYVTVGFPPQSWQYKVLTQMEKRNYKVRPTFLPILDQCLLNIGQQLEVPEALTVIAEAEAKATAAARAAAQ
jgi:hypothetical protein